MGFFYFEFPQNLPPYSLFGLFTVPDGGIRIVAGLPSLPRCVEIFSALSSQKPEIRKTFFFDGPNWFALIHEPNCYEVGCRVRALNPKVAILVAMIKTTTPITNIRQTFVLEIYPNLFFILELYYPASTQGLKNIEIDLDLDIASTLTFQSIS